MANAKPKTTTPPAPAGVAAAPAVPNKTATVIAMLQRQEGAALGDLVAATGYPTRLSRCGAAREIMVQAPARGICS